jgi:polyisoprenyl-teichoic acid--peptidoglycan teichoic acid transferase
MRSKHVIIIAFIIILSLCSLVLYSSFNNPVPDSHFTLLQPYYKSLLNNVVDYTNNNEDLLLTILGTDERKNEKSRSDVIIVLKYKPKENKVIVVSVPRDSKIPISGKGLSKINSAYAFGGSKLQVSTLENLFKIKNVRYIHVNFEGFRKIVDTLGGIKINAKKDFKRDDEKEYIYAKKGENTLMGEDLLEYVRFRDDSEGDFGRIKRQQEVLLSFALSVLDPNNINNLPKDILLVSKNFDSDMDIFFIMKYFKKLKNLDSLKFEFYTLKTYSEKINGIWYEIIEEEDLDFISDLLQN